MHLVFVRPAPIHWECDCQILKHFQFVDTGSEVLALRFRCYTACPCWFVGEAYFQHLGSSVELLLFLNCSLNLRIGYINSINMEYCDTRRPCFVHLETLDLRHYNWCYFSRHIFWPGPSKDSWQSLCVHRVCGEFLRCERIGCPTLRPIASSSHQAGPTKHNRVLSQAMTAESSKIEDQLQAGRGQ